MPSSKFTVAVYLAVSSRGQALVAAVEDGRTVTVDHTKDARAADPGYVYAMYLGARERSGSEERTVAGGPSKAR